MQTQLTESPKPTITVGQRVQLHEFCAEWMQGDGYGVVVAISEEAVKVCLDKYGTCVWHHTDNVLPV